MAGDTLITMVGNVVDDPELRFTPSGAAVANFRVATNPRHFDKNRNEWVDDPSLFLSCSVWRQYAENVAETVTKGQRVIVQGRLKQRSYETQQGEKRTVYELDVEEVGPALRYATAKVSRQTRQQGNSGGQQQGNYQQGGQSQGGDPWATPSGGSQAGDPWGVPGGAAPDDPPF